MKIRKGGEEGDIKNEILVEDDIISDDRMSVSELMNEGDTTPLIKLLREATHEQRNISNNEQINEDILYRILQRIKYHPEEVNIPTESGATPLILAVDYPLQEPLIVQAILDTNKISNKDRKIALELAIDNFDAESQNRLEDINVNTINKLFNITEMLKLRYRRQGGSKRKKSKKKINSKKKTIRKNKRRNTKRLRS